MSVDEEKKVASPHPLVVFDLETTFPRKGHKPQIIEFGSIDVHAPGLYETASYSTLVRPTTITAVTKKSTDLNGITQDMLRDEKSFSEVADVIYDHLHNKIWAGHNIVAFDIPVLTRAFEAISHRVPVCTGVLDTCRMVRTSSYSRRAGNNTLDALSKYTGHGAGRHRAMADCRTTLDVLKSVCARLYLESTLPALFVPIHAPKKKMDELEKAMSGLAVVGDEPDVIDA